jgi:hypothetical protein
MGPLLPSGLVTIRPLQRFPGYFLSDEGVVYSELKHGRFARSGRRAITFQQNQDGYLCARFSARGRRTKIPVHRLVLEEFVGPRPAGAVARHWDDNKTNNSVGNLLWGSPRDNLIDAYRNGKISGIPSRLTSEIVRLVRAIYASGDATQQELADAVGVNQTMIGFVVRGVVWNSAGGPITPGRQRKHRKV